MDGEVNREKKMEVKPFQDAWMDGWIDERVDVQIYCIQSKKQMDGWMDDDIWMERWMISYIDKEMDGQKD